MTDLAGAALTVAAGAAALALSLPGTAAMIRIARRIGFIDHPGGHKSHREPVAYGGGIAIFAAAAVPMFAALAAAELADVGWIRAQWGEAAALLLGGVRLRMTQALVILAGALVMHVLGLIDDVRPLGPYPKLAVTVAVAASVSIFGDVRIGQFFGPVAAVAITVTWMVVVSNSFNFLDNMDGLSAGVAAICTAFVVAAGLLKGQLLVAAMGCLVGGAILGFLFFNFPPARIFMGDGGSLFIGYMIAVLTALTTYFESGHGDPPYALAMPLVILAVPLYDFVSVVVIRIAEGRNPMKGDQRHFSHRLVERGLSRRSAVLTIYLATAATGLSSTLLPGADARQSVTIAVIVLMVLAIICILELPLRKNA